MSIKISYHNLPEEIKEQISEEVAQEFLDYRQAMPRDKRINTQGAFKRQMKLALRAAEIGMTPDELIEFTIDRAWRGINISYTKNWFANNVKAEMKAYEVASGGIKTRNIPISEEMNDTSWGENKRTRNVSIQQGLTDTSWSE